MAVEALIVIAALILMSLLMVLWKRRFAVLSVAILLGSAYLLLTSDMFLVIRLPTACVAGMGVLVALWGLSAPIGCRKQREPILQKPKKSPRLQ